MRGGRNAQEDFAADVPDTIEQKEESNKSALISARQSMLVRSESMARSLVPGLLPKLLRSRLTSSGYRSAKSFEPSISSCVQGLVAMGGPPKDSGCRSQAGNSGEQALVVESTTSSR